jgi:glycerophosphoryl diester phosphodiesterase
MTFFTEKKLIGGHRGSPLNKKENTLDSFRAAIDEGVDFIEFDIRLSSDNRLIIHHDPSVSGHRLSEMSFKEIRSLSSVIGYEIPSIEEVIEICAGKMMLDAEIKEDMASVPSAELLLRNFDINSFIVTSFSVEALMMVKNKYPHIHRGILFESKLPEDVHSIIKKIEPSFLLPHHTVFFGSIKKVSEASGIKSIPYTVNNNSDMIKFLNEPAIAGIISDKTETALSIELKK